MMVSGGLLVGLIVLLLFLLLVGGGIAAAVWLTGKGSPGIGQRAGQDPLHENEALEILRQRYARGEIDREEFQRMREELQS